jgi:hypothetical protein
VPRRSAPSALALLVAATVVVDLAAPSTAQADEGERAVFVEAGPTFARAAAAADPTLGAIGGGAAWIGLRPNVWGFLSLGGGTVGTGALGEAYAGIALTLDVLRWVPALELGVGADLFAARLAPNARLGLGVDVFVSSRLTLGAMVRARPGFAEGGMLVATTLRLGWRWD